jgi:hypothetical protein
MNTAAKPAAANGKLFAVAPMMDERDNRKKTMGYKALCAQRVQ